MPVDDPVDSPWRNGACIAVRALLRESSWASLGTIDAATGAPYVSLVQIATSHACAPLLLISALARHTRNLAADPRCSLLVDRRATDHGPAAVARASLSGRAHRDGSAEVCRRFLARHPDASAYADFGDFQFWSIEVDSAHLVAGFGAITTVAGRDVRVPRKVADVFADAERALDLFSRAHAGLIARLDGPEPARITGLDADGLDLVRGRGVERVAYATDSYDPTDAHACAAASIHLRCNMISDLSQQHSDQERKSQG